MEITAFPGRKPARRFRAYDAHGDGRISPDEYKKAFANGLSETPESFDVPGSLD